ncbi:uncharacterized protein LOC134319102 [Trichomycterus rosablanca]|uniref:uncharacterized protein LOC134319102 n=1 Tax=Trichomycterus rosablanca TaxID=2290929 RepID=UPI002F356978
MPRVNKVDVVQSKVPDLQEPSLQYFRGELGESLFVKSAEFDSSDKDMEITCGSYNCLHDPHLKNFFNQPQRKKHLLKQGLIIQDDQVLCSVKDLVQYMRYIRRVLMSWNKLHQQEQKQLLKKFMVLKLNGGVPENISAAHMKEWLIYRERSTFRNIFKKNVKQGSNSSYAEKAWEVNQRIELEEMEKKILRELSVERRIPQRPVDVPSKLENVQKIFVLPCSSGSTISPADDQAEGTLLAQDSTLENSPTENSIQKFSQSADGAAASMLMKVEDLKQFVSGIKTTTVMEVQENQLPALVEFVHPTQSTLVHLPDLVLSQNLTKSPSSGIKSDSSGGFESSVVMSSSDESVNTPPLLSTAEKLVLEVLYCSASLIKCQQEESNDKADDFENLDLDVQLPSPSPSSVSSVEVIRERNVITPVEEPETSFQFSNTEEPEVTFLGFRPQRTCQSRTSPTSQHVQIENMSEDIVGYTLDMVISVLASEGLLSLQETSDMSDVSSPENYIESDMFASCGTTDESQSPTQCSCSDSGSQLSLQSKKVVSETLVGIQRKLSDQSLTEIISPDNSDAISDLISGILRQIQESPSLDASELISSSSSESSFISLSHDCKAQSGSEIMGDELVMKNIQPHIGTISKAQRKPSDVNGDVINSLVLEVLGSALFENPSEKTSHLDALNRDQTVRLVKSSDNTAERPCHQRPKSCPLLKKDSTSNAAGASASQTPENPTGKKQKKKKSVRSLFMMAWKVVKRTFTRRSNKISPI